MTNCCGFNSKMINEKFDVKINQTENGLTIDVSPKDKSKVESLQKFAEACKELCDCDC